MIQHSGIRTIPNFRVVVLAVLVTIVAGQAQRLQIQIFQPLLSPPRGMQPGLLMQRSGRWGAAHFLKAFFKAFFKALGLEGAGEFAHCGQPVPRLSALVAIAGPCVPSGDFKI